jgi:hypothetical protein
LNESGTAFWLLEVGRVVRVEDELGGPVQHSLGDR